MERNLRKPVRLVASRDDKTVVVAIKTVLSTLYKKTSTAPLDLRLI